MNKEPLISSEVFDYLRNLAIEPYTALSDIAREQLGDGVRLAAFLLKQSGYNAVSMKGGMSGWGGDTVCGAPIPIAA